MQPKQNPYKCILSKRVFLIMKNSPLSFINWLKERGKDNFILLLERKCRFTRMKRAILWYKYFDKDYVHLCKSWPKTQMFWMAETTHCEPVFFSINILGYTCFNHFKQSKLVTTLWDIILLFCLSTFSVVCGRSFLPD